jgi:hypothetical protein
VNKTPELLIPALRQYKHNNGEEGFVCAYDRDEVNALYTKLADEQKRNKNLLSKYQKAVNLIDDHLENDYAYKKDRIKIYSILDDLTDAIKNN